MKLSAWRWLSLIVIVSVTPQIYAHVQGFMALAIFPIKNIFSATSKSSLAAVIIIVNMSGAFLAATFTALPCGFIAKGHPMKIGLVLTAVTFVSFNYAIWGYDQQFTGFIMLIRTAEYIALTISYLLFTLIGCRIASACQKKAN